MPTYCWRVYRRPVSPALIDAPATRWILSIEASVESPDGRPSMSIASLDTASSPSSGHSARTELSERIERPAPGTSSTLTNIAEAAVDGVSATVSFSGKALHALEPAGELVVDGAEDLALGAWHGVQAAAVGRRAVGEAVDDGAQNRLHGEIRRTELGHYASVGMHATGEAVSEVASGSVMAASAVGKTVLALV